MSTNDINLLRGIHELVNTQNVKAGLDYEQIEKKFTAPGGIAAKTKDPNEAFKSELSTLAKTLGLKFDSPKSAKSATSANIPSARENYGSSNRNIQSDLQQSPSSPSPQRSQLSPKQSSPSRQQSSGLGLPSSYLSAESPDDNDDNDDDSNHNSPQSPTSSSNPFPNFDYSKTRASTPSNSSYTGSAELERRTHEQSMHDQIRNVMGNMKQADSNFISLEEASKEDEKTNMLEEIDSLRSSLEEEDAKGLDKIPSVTQSNTYTEVENVLRRLRLKNDRARYTGLADEFLLWGAQGLEELFDGKRKWMGKSPDLTGWSKEVHVKLRRMRHDTSTLVSEVMHDYNIGPGMRIVLELVPNMFMYAKRRKQNYGKASMYADDDIAKHMNNIRSVDED